MMIRTLAAASLTLAAFGAQATTVFADNFDANTLNVNVAPVGWTVTNGTVDIIGPGFYDLLPGNGAYIDLDGSSSDAGELSTSLILAAGVQYTASFQLAGNQRSGNHETVNVAFGGSTAVYTLPMSQSFTTYTLSFTPTSSGSHTLSFSNDGGDNVGALLDNVSVTAVPEPGSVALALAGLGIAGLFLRRRQG